MLIPKEIESKDILIKNFEKSHNMITLIVKEYKIQVEELRTIRDEQIHNLDDQIRELRSQKSDIEYITSQQLKILEEDLRDRCTALHKDMDNVQFDHGEKLSPSHRTLF